MGSYAHRRLVYHSNVIPAHNDGVRAVSYTHLDVYKRQEKDVADREAVANEVPTKSRGEIIVEEAMVSMPSKKKK